MRAFRDVDKIKEILWQKCDEYDFEDDYNSGVIYGLTKAIQIIDEQPTVESKECGEWLKIGKQHIQEWQMVNKCSACGHAVTNSAYVDSVVYFKFCPHCGAKMEV